MLTGKHDSTEAAMNGDYAAELADFARTAAFEAGALRTCTFHSDVILIETDLLLSGKRIG